MTKATAPEYVKYRWRPDVLVSSSDTNTNAAHQIQMAQFVDQYLKRYAAGSCANAAMPLLALQLQEYSYPLAGWHRVPVASKFVLKHQKRHC